MDLDFETVRALSSPTRIRILNQVMDDESTPTSLSDDLDRSKSTISSHLDKLVEAGLVEKEAEEGRRRVVYTPTRKARAIVEGRERKVRFSITSSIVSGIAGFALLGYSQLGFMAKAGTKAAEAGGALSADSYSAAEAGAEAAGGASGFPDPATVVLAVSLVFLGISLSGIFYGLVMNRLGS